MTEFPVIESAFIEIRVVSPFMMTMVVFVAVIIMFSSSKYLVTKIGAIINKDKAIIRMPVPITNEICLDNIFILKVSNLFKENNKEFR